MLEKLTFPLSESIPVIEMAPLQESYYFLKKIFWENVYLWNILNTNICLHFLVAYLNTTFLRKQYIAI